MLKKWLKKWLGIEEISKEATGWADRIEMIESSFSHIERVVKSLGDAVDVFDNYIGKFEFEKRPQQDQIKAIHDSLLLLDSEVEEIRHLQDKYTLPGDLIKQVIELQRAMKELVDE